MQQRRGSCWTYLAAFLIAMAAPAAAQSPWNCPAEGAAIMSCSAMGKLTDGQTQQSYPLIVPESTPGFSIRILSDVENGHVAMNLCPPNATRPEDCIPSITLLESPATQRLVLYMAPYTLDAVPGTWDLQFTWQYGLPQFAVELSVTTAPVTLHATDRAAVKEVFDVCCPKVDENSPCSMLQAATLDAPNATADLCHQPFMRCGADGHLEDFLLPNLYGSVNPALSCSAFPQAFAKLPELKRLDLSGNDLNNVDISSVSSVLGASSSLRWLLLRYTGLTGKLSCDLLSPNLNVLAVTGNNLQGEVPDCVVNSATLTHLYAGENGFTGTLPAIGSNPTLYFLSLMSQVGDGLGGQIPDLSGASALRYVQLGGNSFIGALPPLPPNLRLLNVSSNTLSGNLPDMPASLVVLEAGYNNMAGTLPASLANLATLLRLELGHNGFSGGVPDTWPPMLRELKLRGNLLQGQFPDLPSTLRFLDIASNFFAGPLPKVPEDNGILEWYDVSDNAFTGAVPAYLPSAPHLVYLNASSNQLSSLGEADYWNISADASFLQTVDLSDNALTGAVPGFLATVPALSYINLSNNQLSGSLDAFAAGLGGNYWVGAVLDLANNQLSGDLPAGLANLAALADTSIGYMTANGPGTTRVLNVSFNNFTGEVPAYLYQSLPVTIAPSCGPNPAADAAPCDIQVRIYGNNLTCPTSQGNLTEDQLYALRGLELGCQMGAGADLKELASVLAGAPAAYVAPGWSHETSEDALGDSAGHPSGQPLLSPGAIAGIVIGAVAGAGLIAAALAVTILAVRRRYAVRIPEAAPGAAGAGAVTGALESTVGPLAATTPGAVCVSAPVNVVPGTYAPSQGPAVGSKYLAGDNIV